MHTPRTLLCVDQGQLRNYTTSIFLCHTTATSKISNRHQRLDGASHQHYLASHHHKRLEHMRGRDDTERLPYTISGDSIARLHDSAHDEGLAELNIPYPAIQLHRPSIACVAPSQSGDWPPHVKVQLAIPCGSIACFTPPFPELPRVFCVWKSQ